MWGVPVPELELQSYTTDPTANYLAGICDLDIHHGPDGVFLYATTRAGGGLTVFEITESGLELRDQQSLPGQGVLVPQGGLELMSIDGELTALVTGLGHDSPPAWQVQGDGSFGTGITLDTGFDGMAAQYFAVDVDGETYLYASWAGSDRISAYHLDATGDLTLTYDSPAEPAAGVGAADFTSLSVENRDYLVVAMPADNQLLAYEIGANGALTEVSSAGADQGLSITMPTALTSFEIGGTAYVISAASGSNSLAVMQLDAEGALIPTDHVMDDLDLRFSGACHLESLVVGERAYVLAAGDDDGLSLFQMLPDGRLMHLDTLADDTAMGLADVSALALSESDGVLQIYVSSGSEPGVTTLTYDPGVIGVTLAGGPGADTLQGGADQDILYGDAGDDHLQGGAGDDVLIDGAGMDVLQGGDGADLFVLTHDGQRDVITDFDPDEDQLDLSALPLLHGADQLSVVSTGTGAELYFADEVLEVHTVDGSSLSAAQVTSWTVVPLDRIAISDVVPQQSQQGTAGADSLSGSAGMDILYGLAGDDVLLGLAGNDLLDGGEGDDTLDGGSGSDTMDGGAGLDTVTYADASGGVTARLDGELSTGQAVGDSLSNVENLLGSAFGDALVGSNGDNVLSGLGGHDNLYGLEGNDLLLGEAGNDALYGQAGDDTLRGGVGNDMLDGGTGDDTLQGGAGDDTLQGGLGSDHLAGEDGRDTVSYAGAAGGVTARLDGGDNVGQAAGDSITNVENLTGSYSRDALVGSSGDNVLSGLGGQDSLYGLEGNDLLLGDADNDALYGQAGDDTLQGGAGDDHLDGGDGEDVFIFQAGEDLIADFKDDIDLLILELSALELAPDSNVEDVLALAVLVSGDVVFDFGNGNILTLEGISSIVALEDDLLLM